MNTNEKLLSLLMSGKMEDLENALKENIRENENVKSGSKKPYTIIKNLLAADKKNGARFQGFIDCIDGFYYFLDGHRIYKTPNNYSYEKSENSINNVNRITDDAKSTCDKHFKIDISDLKTYIKISKAEKSKQPYIINYNGYFIAVNPTFLLEALQFCETDIIYFAKKGESHKTFLYMEGTENSAAVLPVCLQKIDGLIANFEIIDEPAPALEKTEKTENNNNEFNNLYNDVKKELNALHDFIKEKTDAGYKLTFDLADKYDMFISLSEQLDNDPIHFDFNYCNYKLWAYAEYYAGVYDEKINDFIYGENDSNKTKCNVIKFIQSSTRDFMTKCNKHYIDLQNAS